jgi:DNA-binding LacI/PurR family transcriptional regulator
MHDVARRAGVSQSTVSLVLNEQLKSVRISDETRQRVYQAARDLGYRRNELARSMVTGNNRILSVLSSFPETEYKARMISGILSSADEGGYHVKVVPLNDDGPDPQVAARCMSLRPAGLLAISPLRPAVETLHKEAARFRVPIVTIDTSFQPPFGIRVASDDYTGARLAIEHLITLGHHRIGFLGGPREAGPFLMREEGFRWALQDLGLPLREQFIAAFDVLYTAWDERARALVRGWLQNPAGPTAIFCANDYIAMRAVRAVTTIGRNVPTDMSIIGYSDVSVAEYGNPPLTTIVQPLIEMGRIAARRLMQRINENNQHKGHPHYDDEEWDDEPLQEILPTRLIIRESTGPARR